MNRTGQNQQPDIITLFQALVKTDMEHFTVSDEQQEDQFAGILQAMQGGV